MEDLQLKNILKTYFILPSMTDNFLIDPCFRYIILYIVYLLSIYFLRLKMPAKVTFLVLSMDSKKCNVNIYLK